MKTIFFGLSFFTSIFLAAPQAEDFSSIKVPEAVTAAFEAKFPNATEVEYEQEHSHFVVDFEVKGVDHEAEYQADGTLIRYKYELLLSELPQPISTTVKKDFGELVIDDAEVMVINGVSYYQLELESTTVEKELVFDQEGTLHQNIPYWD